MVRRTRAEAEETRVTILDAAEQEFLERGVSRTTLDHIARRAGVTRGAIYWHFRDKSDLFTAMVDRVQLPMSELSDSYRSELGAHDPVGAQQQLCRVALERLAGNTTYRNVYAILFTRCEFVAECNPSQSHQHDLEQQVLDGFVEDFQRARDLGQLAPRVEPRIAALTLFSLLHGIYLCWLRAPERFDVERDGMAMLTLFFDSVRLPPQEASEVGTAKKTAAAKRQRSVSSLPKRPLQPN